MRQAIAVSVRGPMMRAFFEDSRLAMPLLVHLRASQGSHALSEPEMGMMDEVLRLLEGRGSAGELLFTARELEILQQLMLHNNNKLIARALGVTPDTVRFHLKKIYEKLGVNDRKVVCSLIGALPAGCCHKARRALGISQIALESEIRLRHRAAATLRVCLS